MEILARKARERSTRGARKREQVDARKMRRMAVTS
jgi:hypothetical protein